MLVHGKMKTNTCAQISGKTKEKSSNAKDEKFNLLTAVDVFNYKYIRNKTMLEKNE